jgi:hypothetical protein
LQVHPKINSMAEDRRSASPVIPLAADYVSCWSFGSI